MLLRRILNRVVLVIRRVMNSLGILRVLVLIRMRVRLWKLLNSIRSWSGLSWLWLLLIRLLKCLLWRIILTLISRGLKYIENRLSCVLTRILRNLLMNLWTVMVNRWRSLRCRLVRFVRVRRCGNLVHWRPLCRVRMRVLVRLTCLN